MLQEMWVMVLLLCIYSISQIKDTVADEMIENLDSMMRKLLTTSKITLTKRTQH